MAYEEAKTSTAIVLTEYPNKPLEAYYLGRKIVRNDIGDNSLHKFEKTDGTILEVWGFDLLNRSLMSVPPGCMTKITYTGTKEENGKKQHQCTVLFDKLKKVETAHSTKTDDLPF